MEVPINAKPIVVKERRREETSDGGGVVDQVNQVIGRYIKPHSEDALSDIQGFELPMIGDTLLPTENHIPTIKEQLANIDVGLLDLRLREVGMRGLGLNSLITNWMK